jgi:hypothetical protein
VSAGRKQAGKRKSVPAKKSTAKTDSPAVSQKRGASGSVSVRNILGECAAAICLVEVTMHSLQSREIGHPEQEVLKRALKLNWSVHDWIDESNPGHLDGDDEDREDEP